MENVLYKKNMRKLLSFALASLFFVSGISINSPTVQASNIMERADDVGNFKEVYGAFDLSELPSISVSGNNNTLDTADEMKSLHGTRVNTVLTSPNQTVLVTGISGNTTTAYTDSSTGNTYGVYSRERISATISSLDEKTYPGIKNTDATKVYQFNQTNGDGYIFRFQNMLYDDAFSDAEVGDQITISFKVYFGDIKAHASYTTSAGESVGEQSDTTTKYIPARIGMRKTTEGATTSTAGTDWDWETEELVPVNRWYTIAYTKTITEDDLSNLATSRGVFIKSPYSRNTKSSLTNPYAGSVFVEGTSISVFKDTSTSHLDYVNYTEDFEDVDLKLEKGYDEDKRKTGVIGDGTQYIGGSTNYRFGEEKIAVNSAYNTTLSTNAYDVDGIDYTYTYTPSRTIDKPGSAQGRYHGFGTVNTVLNAFTDKAFMTTRRNPSAYEYALSETKDETGTREISTYAHSGTKAVMFSGRRHVNGAMRFENIFGFNPTAMDKNRKFRISFYIYPDSTQGALSGGTNDIKYAVTSDKVTPTIDVYMNGPASSGYANRNNAVLNPVNDKVLKWDQWNKVEFDWAIGNNYDTGATTGNPLANCLTIREAIAGNIVDTYFIDDISVKEIIPNVRMYVTKGEDTISAKAVIGSMADVDSDTAILIVASYDNRGKMIDMKVSDEMDLTASLPVSSTDVSVDANAVSYKIFVWDSLEGVRPITDKTNINGFDGKKIIIIGNSFSYYGKQVIVKNSSLDQTSRSNDNGYFYQLCKANGLDVSVTNWTFGGHSLNNTFSESCAANRSCDGENHLAYLTDRNFDYVVIQPGSANTDEEVNMVYNIMNIFKEANNNVKFVYVIPHRFHDSSYDKLINLADDLKKEGVIIADWGKLVYDIIEGKAEVPGATEEYNRNTFVVTQSAADGYHQNMLAGYITTLMTYCAITGEDAEGQPYGFCTDSSLNSHFDVEDFLDTYYTYDNISPEGSSETLTGDALTTFPEVFASESDMLGIQKLIDIYLEK